MNLKLIIGILIVGVVVGIASFLLLNQINYILETTDITGMPL